jgi:lipopolysaccharide/colanic/teichoic acid biosynthesis glycosyltransferase
VEAHQLLIARPEQSRIAACLRRGLDIVLAATALLLLSPVVAVVAISIAVSSPGPIVFRQRRLGLDLDPFTVLKFRTMHADADSAPHRDYVRTLIDRQDEGTTRGGLYKLAVDDRVTGVGRLLRKWSLDELPQLWNVIRGDMALVGPRPVIPYEAELYPPAYLRRFSVKPGLTGLWQVSGRNERTYEEMVRLDVEYAERNSIGLDLLILAKTVWVVLTRKGAA